MSDREAMKLALEALKAMQSYAAAERKGLRICDEAIEALRAALAAPDELKAEIDRYEEMRQMWAQRVAENGRLRMALQWIASRCPTDQFVDLQPHRIHLEAAHDAGACARAALKKVPR